MNLGILWNTLFLEKHVSSLFQTTEEVAIPRLQLRNTAQGWMTWLTVFLRPHLGREWCHESIHQQHQGIDKGHTRPATNDKPPTPWQTNKLLPRSSKHLPHPHKNKQNQLSTTAKVGNRGPKHSPPQHQHLWKPPAPVLICQTPKPGDALD